jgi:hypothetical protein
MRRAGRVSIRLIVRTFMRVLSTQMFLASQSLISNA